MKKDIEVESDVPLPGAVEEMNRKLDEMAASPPVMAESDWQQSDAIRRENQLLKLQLENAELRAKLAAVKAVPPGTPKPETIQVGKALPQPHEIPSGLPPMPPVDPLMGDKTPAIVEWFRDHWPDQYESRYKGRKVHLRKNATVEDEDAGAPDMKPCSDPSIDTSPRSYSNA